MSRSSSNETYELFIDDYDDYYNEPMVAWPNPCPTPPPSPPYPYAYPYQANPLTDWVPSGVWTPWTPYNSPVPNSYVSYAIPYQNPYPWGWNPWTPCLPEPYVWTNYGTNTMFTPPPSPVTIPPGSILTPPMLLVPVPVRHRYYHPRPKQTLALKKNYQAGPPKEALALRVNQQQRHELTIWDQIQGSFSELQSSSRKIPTAEELASEEEEQPDHDENMNDMPEVRAYELNEVNVEEVENALIRDEVEEIFIADEDEMEDLTNTLADDNAEEILNALVGDEEEEDEVKTNSTAESSFEFVEPLEEEAEHNGQDDNPLLFHMKECGSISCKDRGKPHMHSPHGNWIF